MGTTGKGFPYPEPTEPVAQGANAIKALATAVDTRLGVSAAGVVTIPMNNAVTGQATIVFPAGRFAAAPSVVASAEDGSFFAVVQAITATNYRAFIRQSSGTAVTRDVVVAWIARSIG